MNATGAFLDDHVAQGRGDRAALVTPDATYTYADVLALAARGGNAFRRLGVEPEQRVAILLHDGSAFAAAFFGVLRIGAVAVPLNTRLRPDDYVPILRDCRAKVLVAEAALVEELCPRFASLPHLRAVLSVGSTGCAELFDAHLKRAAATLAPEPVSGDDMAFWLYTSGSTGAPKAAVHLHRDLLNGRPYGSEVLGMTAEDRVFSTSRLFFAYPLGNAFLLPLFLGASAVLHPAWPDPATVAAVMERFRPTILFSVPTFYARLLRAEPPPGTFRSLRLAVSAGERLPGGLHQAYRERFGVEILDAMGATETVFMLLANRPGQSRPGSSGWPVPGVEVRLLDAEGREVAAGEEGVLHVKMPSTSPCYWNRLDTSRRTFVGEWFCTGDVYTRDADGFYYHRGRADDFFKVAGLWVAPSEVEAVLLGHPEVVDAGVVGAEEAGGLVKPFAFVVPREGTSADRLVTELTALAEAKLPPHQRPRRIAVVGELPRTATGKLQRFVLREQVREG
jgi:benzoate-CoA ligase family protein